jgi:hypothetical protein
MESKLSALGISTITGKSSSFAGLQALPPACKASPISRGTRTMTAILQLGQSLACPYSRATSCIPTWLTFGDIVPGDDPHSLAESIYYIANLLSFTLSTRFPFVSRGGITLRRMRLLEPEFLAQIALESMNEASHSTLLDLVPFTSCRSPI